MGRKKIGYIIMSFLFALILASIGILYWESKKDSKFPAIFYSDFENWGELGLFKQGKIVEPKFFSTSKTGFLEIGQKPELTTISLWVEKGIIPYTKGKLNFTQPFGGPQRELILTDTEIRIEWAKLFHQGGVIEFEKTTILVKEGRIFLDSRGFFHFNSANSEITAAYFTLWIDEGVIVPERGNIIVNKGLVHIDDGRLIINKGILNLPGLVLNFQGTIINYLPEKVEIRKPTGEIFQTGTWVRVIIPGAYNPENWLNEKGTRPVFTIKVFPVEQFALMSLTILPLLILFTWLFVAGGLSMLAGMVEELKLKKFFTGVTLADFAGNPEIKKEMQELVLYCKYPERYQELGVRPPRGVLLTGPPGTGKTLLARCIAGEVGGGFFAYSGPSFSKMWMGQGAESVRKTFETARKWAKKNRRAAIVFVDEINAVLKVRYSGATHGEIDAQRTTEEFFIEMDGLQQAKEAVVIIGATNRPDILDPAALRPGRFDWQFEVPRPDSSEARLEIIEVHLKGKKISADVDPKVIARETYGFTGADIEKLVNEAGRFAIRRTFKGFMSGHLGKPEIQMVDFRQAVNKVLLGTERKLISNPKRERGTAEHEAGHALVALLNPHARPVRFLSVVPRTHHNLGFVLGLTHFMEGKEVYSRTQNMLEAYLASSTGGMVAEMLVCQDPKEVSDGASGDIKQATLIARAMVRQLGLSRLGFFHFEPTGDPWTGQRFEISEATKREVDLEERRIVQEALQKAQKVISENKDLFDTIVKALFEKKEMDSKELEVTLHQVRPDQKFNLFHLALAEADKERQALAEAEKEEQENKSGLTP